MGLLPHFQFPSGGAASLKQCIGSELDPDSIRSADTDPDLDQSGQNCPQRRKKLKNLIFEELCVVLEAYP